jgi:hypothetical protein
MQGIHSHLPFLGSDLTVAPHSSFCTCIYRQLLLEMFTDYNLGKETEIILF